MAEISNIKEQLEMVVSDMGIPVLSGGSIDDYLCSVGSGMIQFVCVRDGRESFRSLTAERIQIHPGSCMYREEPQFIVAGEIVRTSRMYAMSVSPLTRNMLARIDERLVEKLAGPGKGKAKGKDSDVRLRNTERMPETGKNVKITEGAGKTPKTGKVTEKNDAIVIGGERFDVVKVKGKKQLTLPWEKFKKALGSVDLSSSYTAQLGGLRGKIVFGSHELLFGEKMELIIRVATTFDLEQADEKKWPRNQNFVLADNPEALIDNLRWLFRVTVAKQKSKELGFICLFNDGNGQYWFKCSRGFHTALNETIASLESMIDETSDTIGEESKEKINSLYRKLNSFFN